MQENPNNPPPQGFGLAFWNWVLVNILFIKRRLNGMSEGGGGSQNLQQVTDIGSTTTVPMSVVGVDGDTTTVGTGSLTLNNAVADTVITSTATTKRDISTPDASGIVVLDGDLADYVPYAGATIDVNINNKRITQLATPVAMQDAANKAYVDTVAASLSWKTAVRVASAAALPAGTYSNGTSGVGATFTVTATGILTVDGVDLVLNNRVLIKDQASAFQNGIYTVTTAGAIGVQAVLTRSTDADQPAELVSAAVTTGTEGFTNANKAYIQVTPATITIGSTDLVWNVFLNTILSPGSGIRISGNIIYNRLTEGFAGGQTAIGGTGAEDTFTLQGSSSVIGRSTTAPALILNSGAALEATGSTQVFTSVPFTVNQSGTASYIGLKIAVTETATGSGSKLPLDIQVGGSSKASVSNTGLITTAGGVTMADGTNLVVGSTSGTKIGTATSQKIGFYNATPVGQQSGDIITALGNLGLVTSPSITLPTGSGGLLNVQVLTAGTTTYTPTSGTSTAIIDMLGGGGGGGSTSGVSGTAAGAGGGAGGRCVAKVTSVSGTYTVSVGTGGSGATAGTGTGSTGNTGNSTTFINGATTYTASGGVGGACRTNLTTSNAIACATGGTGGTATNGLINGTGASGGAGIGFVTGTAGTSGAGGDTAYGSGGKALSKDATTGTAGTGNNGAGYGAGGGGGLAVAGSGAVAGGNGANGVIIIYEYR